MSDNLENFKRCRICNPNNSTLYFHFNPEDSAAWVFCNKCNLSYTLYRYCALAGITLRDLLSQPIDFKEAKPNEVQKMEWPPWFLPLYDPRSQKGVDYLKSRGLLPADGLAYDFDAEGIVFPFYFGSVFCGAQTRFIKPRVHADGHEQKIDTLPSSRTGLLFWNYSQAGNLGNVKTIVITEGVFNALSLDQAFKEVLESKGKENTFKFIATSGCNLSNHHSDVLRELMESGYRVILAFDADEAGIAGLQKAIDRKCISGYSLTMDDEEDWNSTLIKRGKIELVKLFLGNITDVKYT